ncbi:MAG: SUF system NifU family Fe-S cluster assembly protein [Caldithrix sp. RBG_13_44_9]|nr:MAG: SUF system NifU family Fe-S cluster assembly protein [Caldithrix sp. RBG_13_44_9]
MELNELYQDIILDHYKHPHNFGEGDSSFTNVELENPVCGDHIKLMVYLNDENIVKEVKFTGSGCAISMASASIMTDELKGKPLSEVQQIIEDVLGSMRGEKAAETLDEHGDLAALKGVMKFPVRVKCATLAWHAVKDAIAKSKRNT